MPDGIWLFIVGGLLGIAIDLLMVCCTCMLVWVELERRKHNAERHTEGLLPKWDRERSFFN